MKWMFKEDHSLEHRCVESAKIRNKYPDRVPVIVEKVSGSQIVDIDKRKYLVPSDITVAQFMWIIRKRIQLPSEKAIFLFVDKTVPQSREIFCPVCVCVWIRCVCGCEEIPDQTAESLDRVQRNLTADPSRQSICES
uniref:GABA(A) receptor-associated protein like 2 n=1 Tax=Cyprinus carpio carpio TaxID=630221 RepID=A0A8C1DTR6_CYPCA